MVNRNFNTLGTAVSTQDSIDNKIGELATALEHGVSATIDWLSGFSYITEAMDINGYDFHYGEVVEALKSAGYNKSDDYDVSLIDETSDIMAQKIISNAIFVMESSMSPNALMEGWVLIYKERVGHEWATKFVEFAA